MSYRFLLLFLFCFSKQYAQFQFSGEINKEFANATAYLNIIDDYNKSTLFLTEQIIQESKIDSLGNFIFEGDFLNKKNRVYKIYLDKCNENINDSKHLLNQCDDSQFIIFIANNKDQIHFPLNDLSQMFCSFQHTSIQNTAINKIDSIQERLLINLYSSKSDKQRNIIYKNYFKKLQNFSKTLKEPLAELYAHYLYSHDESFSREFYIKDLKHSTYYNDLLKNIEKTYPNSDYAKHYKEDLIRDQYPLLKSKYNTFKYLAYALSILLLISLSINYFLYKRNKYFTKKNKKTIINYKTRLSPQEQKVFELMYETHSNKEIAEKLFISISTVKTHINSIYSKLSISSRNEVSLFFK